MKVVLSLQNNNFSKPQKQKIAFEAGLTQKMIQEIRQTDTVQISRKFAQKGIPTDFKGNKVIAWCCYKTAELIEQANKRFGVNLALPRGIFVEDFDNLRVGDSEMTGFCNHAQAKLYKNSDAITPSRTIFFNSIHNWHNVDSMSDSRFATRHSGSDFFLDIFFHEFSHVLHDEHLLDLYDPQTVLAKLQFTQDPHNVAKFQAQYGATVSKVCNYAKTNPLETVACDLSRKLAQSLDKKALIPVQTPFLRVPYKNDELSFVESLEFKISPLKQALRRFWDGKFE